MADPRQRRFRLWSWGQQSTAKSMITTPPTVQQVVEKLTELVNLERGVGALYYYLPDESLSAMAQDLCESHRLANVLEGGIDRALQRRCPRSQPGRLSMPFGIARSGKLVNSSQRLAFVSSKPYAPKVSCGVW